MVTIEQTDIIDGMGIDKSSGQVDLGISDHLDWDDIDYHITILEKKIGSYINFVQSGQMLDALPNAKGLPIRIMLVHQFDPTSSALKILVSVREQLEEIGIKFSYEPLPEGF